MSRGYGQYCPLSLASELLCQRWTILVISRVLMGCTRFNQIQRGLPQLSPTLLARRLEELEAAGVLEAKPSSHGNWKEYSLTPAGQDLAPLIDGLAVWGQNWARDMELEDLDPAFLVWSMHTRLDAARLPPGRTNIAFEFSGAPPNCRKFWLVCTDGDVEMCLKDPGHEVSIRVRSDLRVFIETWRGFRDLRSEIAGGRIVLIGPRRLREQFPDWLLLHSHATHPRLRPGRERRLSRITGPRDPRRESA